MSYSISVIGRDKEKLKAAIRAQQVQDPQNPHAGVPIWVADHLCSEVDRVRIYQFQDRVYALRVEASGSFHEQGGNDSFKLTQEQLVE
jgi:hypothetical protein